MNSLCIPALGPGGAMHAGACRVLLPPERKLSPWRILFDTQHTSGYYIRLSECDALDRRFVGRWAENGEIRFTSCSASLREIHIFSP
jgi:hypothetical protein